MHNITSNTLVITAVWIENVKSHMNRWGSIRCHHWNSVWMMLNVRHRFVISGSYFVLGCREFLPVCPHTHVRRDAGVSCGDDLRQSASQRDSSEWYVGPGLHNVHCTSCVRVYILELWRNRRQTVCSYGVAVFFRTVCFEILFYIPLKLPKLKTWRFLACFCYVATVYVIKTRGCCCLDV